MGRRGRARLCRKCAGADPTERVMEEGKEASVSVTVNKPLTP